MSSVLFPPSVPIMTAQAGSAGAPCNRFVIGPHFEMYPDKQRISTLHIFEGMYDCRKVWVRKESLNKQNISAHEAAISISRLSEISDSNDIVKIFATTDVRQFRYTAVERGTMTFAEVAACKSYPRMRRYMVERMLRIYRFLHGHNIMLRTDNLDSFAVFAAGENFVVKLLNLHCAKVAAGNSTETSLSRLTCSIGTEPNTISYMDDIRFGFVDMALQLLANRPLLGGGPIKPKDFIDAPQAVAWADFLNSIVKPNMPLYENLLSHWALMSDERRCSYLRKLYDWRKEGPAGRALFKAIETISTRDTILGDTGSWRDKLESALAGLHPEVSLDPALTSYGDGKSINKLFAALRHSIVHLNSGVYKVLHGWKQQKYWDHNYAEDEFLWLHFMEERFSPLAFNLWELTKKNQEFKEFHCVGPVFYG